MLSCTVPVAEKKIGMILIFIDLIDYQRKWKLFKFLGKEL